MGERLDVLHLGVVKRGGEKGLVGGWVFKIYIYIYINKAKLQNRILSLSRLRAHLGHGLEAAPELGRVGRQAEVVLQEADRGRGRAGVVQRLMRGWGEKGLVGFIFGGRG